MPPVEERLSPLERRRRIESAATTLFAQQGYAATTVDEIAAAAGLTKPMLYRHFESKQDLCVVLMERFREELVAAPLAQFTPGAAEPDDQLRSMVDAWLAHVQEHPDATRLLFTPVPDDGEIAKVQKLLYLRQRATQVALLREFAPGLDHSEREPLAEALRSSLVGVALWWLDHPDVPREVPTTALFHLAQGTIAAINRTAGTP